MKKAINGRKEKILHPSLMVRKDGKPTCYVCHDKMEALRDLRKMKGTTEEGSDYYNKMLLKVTSTIITVGKMGRQFPLYRCGTCEPGSTKYMKNKYLRKHHTLFLEKERLTL